ncbi:MAG: nucleotide exchange factor GrpE [Spirochaetia bacterium]|nr:nucleotide exchange factor GrpE [Spirochaetia bacterium]
MTEEQVKDQSVEEAQPAPGVDIAGGQSAAPDMASPDSLAERLKKAEEEIARLTDSWTRERAEFQNYKKRVSQDQVRNRAQSIGKFVAGLLPALDNLDRVLAIKSDNEALSGFMQGIEMVRQDVHNVLGRENIKIVKPANEAFDPGFMEAIAMVEDPGVQVDTVLEVFEAGYVLEFGETEKHVIRPARVKVGKPRPAAQAES